MAKSQYPLKIVDVDLKKRKIIRMYSCDEQGREMDLTHGVCHQCGLVAKGLYSSCPRCHTAYQDRVAGLFAFLMRFAYQEKRAVLFDKHDGEYWLFASDGEFQPDGPIPDDVMYYEERETL